ncbi:MAG: BTB/POZ protein [Benjaminiella poitrasii]|nr:MAG: BTB/POZ protein [Benjaminiella poitrasii]
MLMFRGDGGWGYTTFAHLNTLEQLLSTDGALSITVTMTIPKAEIKKHDSIVPYELFADYIESSEFSDISFRVFAHEESDVDDEEEEGQVNNEIVHAHKIVLTAASPWFKSLFSNGMQETSQKVINIYGVSLDIFKRLLHYCYVYDLRIKDLKDAYKIVEAAGRFQLMKAREEAFYAIRQEINEDNVWEVWEYADESDDEKTADACICFINKHAKSVILSGSFLRAKVDKIQTVFDIEITNDTNDNNNKKKEINDKEIADMTKQFETDVADILKSIRFTMIPIEYLIKSVETDDFAMSFDTLRRKLIEGYKYHAALGTSFAQKHKPRRKI